jgi:hypothetical protein
MSTATPASVIQPADWQTVEPFEESRAKLHRRPFRLTHALPGHPLFTVGALLEVAKAAAKRKDDLYCDVGEVKVTDKWGQIPLPDRPVEEVIDRIQNAGAWIIMKHVELDPAYAAVLNEFAEFVFKMTPPDPRFSVSNPEMLVLITSPQRVTSFHFDAEVNFLVQIQGTKRVWVSNPDDRETITDREIERYYWGHQNAGTYKPGVEDRAHVFDLHPGEAVYIPSHSAHWVKNGDDVSVSLSLNFELPPSTWRYPSVTNYALRKFGIHPTPPGKSLGLDKVKSLTGGATAKTLKFLRNTRDRIKS